MRSTLRRPEWLKKKISPGAGRSTSLLLNELGLNTVCREARCPNISECFQNRTATFLILGRRCSRRCLFCGVDKEVPEPVDPDEPRRVACAVQQLDLKHVVVTSVTRDDLPDGGAGLFVKTVDEIRQRSEAAVELLISDLSGNRSAIEAVVRSKPDILGHNVETVPRLYALRPGADYQRSLFVLVHAKGTDRTLKTKSALMLGLGETEKEVVAVMRDLRNAGCDFLALGQYLRPSLQNTEVAAFIAPEEFLRYKRKALALGFAHVESGPYIRSSAFAERYLK